MGVTYDEIIRSRDLDPIYSIDETANMMIASYDLATNEERSEIELLVRDFKREDTPSDDVYDAVYNAIFGGSWHVSIGSREFLVAFATTAKKATGGRAGMKTT